MLVFYFFLDSSSVLTHPAHLFPSGTTPGSALPACQHPTPGSAPPHPLRVTALPKARVWINEAQMPDWGLRLQVLALEQQLGSPPAPHRPVLLAQLLLGLPGNSWRAGSGGRCWAGAAAGAQGETRVGLRVRVLVWGAPDEGSHVLSHDAVQMGLPLPRTRRVGGKAGALCRKGTGVTGPEWKGMAGPSQGGQIKYKDGIGETHAKKHCSLSIGSSYLTGILYFYWLSQAILTTPQLNFFFK